MELDGYVSLWRKSINSRVFKNEGLWKVWTWCLMKANHEEKWISLKTGKGVIEVFVKPGQFVFGRYSASAELAMNPNTTWKRMQKLKNLQNINIESNSQYSIITIVNWDTYQVEPKKSNSKSNRQVTGKCLSSNTNNNDNNENKELPSGFFTLSKRFLEYQKKQHGNLVKITESKINSGAETIDKLVRIDGFDLEQEIKPVLNWAAKDSFWSTNVLSLAGLRKKQNNGETKFQNIYASFKRKNKNATKQSGPVY
jgi:hypothetical protein